MAPLRAVEVEGRVRRQEEQARVFDAALGAPVDRGPGLVEAMPDMAVELGILLLRDLAARPLGGWLVYGLCVGMAGMMGDLAESLVKRDLGAKDSGSILGGMGGFLDLADSLLLAGPVAWLLWALG